jgi:hypothetical protein
MGGLGALRGTHLLRRRASGLAASISLTPLDNDPAHDLRPGQEVSTVTVESHNRLR